MFLFFSAAKHLISRNQAEILMVRSGLEQYQPISERVLLTNFRKLSNECFEINHDEPLNKRISKLKCILYTLYIIHFKNTKYFLLHAVWYKDRAIQLLKFSMSQEVKKGPFAALTFESSKNFILRYFQKLMWFYLLVTKDSLLGKVWGKTFFRCEMPWTALTEIAS